MNHYIGWKVDRTADVGLVVVALTLHEELLFVRLHPRVLII